MPLSKRQQRDAIARLRLRSILRQHTIAVARTIEQKISDAGPTDQRIDPHVLTRVRNSMVRGGEIATRKHEGIDWYSLPDAEPSVLEGRLREQAETIKELRRSAFNQRMGQTLEIATYRALLASGGIFLGRFRDLDQHADDTLYSKEEPPQHLGPQSLEGDRRLDFLVPASSGDWLGIECKNIREWLYPDRDEVHESIAKCLELDCVPVIISRRIPYVTFRLLRPCGVIVHQTYNQLFPFSDQALADRARHKRNLGYHDIRVGNTPDARLLRFIGQNMPAVAEEARSRFDAYKDLLAQFVSGDLAYDEFAARVRRRESGSNEDHDWDESGDPADWE
jgi:hypothetical protein